MDFFEHQDQARGRTQTLILLFVLTVVLLVAAVYFAAMMALLGTSGVEREPDLWRGDVFGIVAVVTLSIVGFGTLHKLRQLASGGPAVAKMLGGQQVDPSTHDKAERRLINVVEEMAIASGVPVPPVYLLPKEDGINAFAAGFTQTDAVIAVTRGTVENLNRDELQGVVAHEFSHILNGDMRLNVRLMGVIHGILVIALIGGGLLRGSSHSSRGRSGKGGGSLALFGLALYLIGGIGVFFGRVIKGAVSREREYLADASAVQFTRNPGGIAGALKKIGALTSGSLLAHPKAEQASHMYFGNGLNKSWFSWLSTHPPLVDRIARIQPTFDGVFPQMDALLAQRDHGAQSLASPAAVAGFAGAVDRPAHAVARAGTITQNDIAGAHRLLEELPAELRNHTRDAAAARALVFALLLDDDTQLRDRQLGMLDDPECGSADVANVARQLLEVPRAARLPLAELCIPALTRLSPDHFDRFLENVRRLVTADARTTLFEYAIQRLLRHHRALVRGDPVPPSSGSYTLRSLRDRCATLLAALARAGAEDEATARHAYERGVKELNLGLDPDQMASAPETTLRAVDQALEKLASLAPKAKRRLFAALVEVASLDNVMTERELSLLRVVALVLGIPIPLALGLSDLS